jgi:dolichol-phosphate mannosyltransferase
MVMDDGSTDGIESEFGVQLLRHDRNYGVGRAFKTAFEYFLKSDFEVFVAFAGNNKDEPLEIPQLVAPIASGEADIVQGSRHLHGGGFGNMPGYRIFATKLHAFLFSLAARKRVTESSNGFRAIHRRVLEDRGSIGGRNGWTSTNWSHICCSRRSAAATGMSRCRVRRSTRTRASARRR